MIEVDYDQLIYLRNSISWLRVYKPYQDRGELQFGAKLWYDYHQDLLDKVNKELEKYDCE